MKCGFNTGRLYVAEGQPITAEVVGDVIVFVDHARGIEGEIPTANMYALDSILTLARHTLYMYDHGQYRGVSSYQGPTFESKRDQMRLGYEAWMKANHLSPVQTFMLR